MPTQRTNSFRVSLLITVAVALSFWDTSRTAAGATHAGPAPAAAPAPTAAASPAATIRQTIESRFHGVHVLDVQASTIPGIYEVFLGNEIVYSDSHGDYLLMGPLVDTQTQENLTEARLTEHGRVDFGSLPLERAIKVVKGNGSRRFAVFSDPDCPFCQQLEQQSLPQITNITMYVFLYPIASLHPQATAKAHAIWCARDRAAAWDAWMHQKKLPSDTPAGGVCTGDPVKELQQLGDKLHVNSTPTIFFSNGRRVAGAIPGSDLERLLTAAGSPQAPPIKSTDR